MGVGRVLRQTIARRTVSESCASRFVSIWGQHAVCNSASPSASPSSCELRFLRSDLSRVISLYRSSVRSWVQEGSRLSSLTLHTLSDQPLHNTEEPRIEIEEHCSDRSDSLKLALGVCCSETGLSGLSTSANQSVDTRRHDCESARGTSMPRAVAVKGSSVRDQANQAG